MTTARRILKNFLSLSFAEVVSKVLAFLAIAYLARVLGAEGFGKIGFAQAILAYFMLLVNLGLNTFGTREVARNREEINKYVNNILTIKLLAAIISFVLLAIFVHFIPKPPDVKKLILLWGLTLFTFAFTIDWLFQGIERMEFIALSRIAKQAVYVGLVFLIVIAPEQLLVVPLIQVIGGLVAVGVLFSVSRSNFSSFKLEFDFGFWKDILKQSLPMGFSFIMITIYYNLDHIMLGFMKSMKVVGWYSAAYKIILLVLTLPGLILAPIFPLLSRYYKEDRKRLDGITNKYVMIMFTIGIPMGFGGTILSSRIIRLVYGSEFSNAVLPLQILSWNIVMVFINVAYGNPLLAWNKQKRYMKGIAAGAITNLIFNLLLIPRFSLIGASIATVLAEIAVFFGLYFEFQKVVRISVFKYSYKPMIGSITMVVTMLLLGKYIENIFPLLSVGILSYLASVLILRIITINDLRLFFAKEEA